MDQSITSPLGVCVLPTQPLNAARTVSYGEYAHEILGHAGVCYESVLLEDLEAKLSNMQLLVTVGEATLPDNLKDQIRLWVENGGAWLGVGGVCGMPDMFGVEVEPPAYSSWGGGLGLLGEGYVKPEDSEHPVLAHIEIPLHYFNGVPVRVTDGKQIAGVLDAHQRPSERASVVEKQVGKGKTVLIAPDITGAVVRIQQGIGITRDGVPAPDGTAPINDYVLKSGDGGVLDWIFDRSPVDGVPGYNAFLQPVADQLREMLLRGIFYIADQQDVTLPVLWLYPRNLPALGHISHDTDLSEADKGRMMLQVLEKAQINSSWCVILPAYPPDLIADIKRAGHETAMHYDSMSDGTVWSEEEFDAQWKKLLESLGQITSNKNHYLRWEGDTEFFQWCIKRGIQLDESKGASKTGEAGFCFGTCHPYFPIDPAGEPLNVLELTTPTQDLIIFAPPELADPLLKAVVKHHGVLHLLFHPAHVDKPGVADALLSAVQKAKDQGVEWWTAKRLNKWERARRQVSWSGYDQNDGNISVNIWTQEELPEASVMWLTRRGIDCDVNGKRIESQQVERWGFSFSSVQLTAKAGQMYQLRVESL